MNPREALTSLDEIIWKQFEKVTNKAHQEVGWTKYDLARRALAVESASFVGYGVYGIIEGAYQPSVTTMVFGGLFTLLSLPFHRVGVSNLDSKEQKELDNLLSSQAAHCPSFGIRRPLGFLVAGIGLYYGIEGENTTPYQSAADLSWLAISSVWITGTIKEYFVDQIMRPPGTKKSIWQAAGEKLFGYTPKPVEVEVNSHLNSHYS